MKVKLKEIFESVPPLKRIFDTPIKDAKLVYALSKTQRAVDRELEDINEGRNAIVKNFGTEKDGQWSVPPEKMEAFTAEMEKYLATEVELDIWKIPFRITDFIDLSSSEMTMAGWIIDAPLEEVTATSQSPVEPNEKVASPTA